MSIDQRFNELVIKRGIDFLKSCVPEKQKLKVLICEDAKRTSYQSAAIKWGSILSKKMDKKNIWRMCNCGRN